MLVLIGSSALSYHMELENPPNDMDIVGTYDEIQEYVASLRNSGVRVIANYPINEGKTVLIKTANTIIEAEVAWPDSRAEKLLTYIMNDDEEDFVHNGFLIPSLNFLYMLKCSHRYLKDSPHFLKTMRDIQCMRKADAFIPYKLGEFYKQRMKDTYTYSHPKLNQSKEKFFDNATSIYTIDHDSIHEAVKHMECPAYEYFKADQAEVMCSKELFFAQPDDTYRLYAGLEEAYVLSIERAIHPYNIKDNEGRKKAFDTALMKLCTSISSGWFREFCYENYDRIQDMYNMEYVDKFYDALHNGRIKAFSEPSKVNS